MSFDQCFTLLVNWSVVGWCVLVCVCALVLVPYLITDTLLLLPLFYLPLINYYDQTNILHDHQCVFLCLQWHRLPNSFFLDFFIFYLLGHINTVPLVHTSWDNKNNSKKAKKKKKKKQRRTHEHTYSNQLMPSVSNEHMYPSLCMCELSVHLSVWPYYVTQRETQQTMVCLVPVVVLCVVLWGAFVSFGTFSLFSFFCITKSQSPKVSPGAEAVATNLNELINSPDKLIAVLRLDYKWQSEQAEQNKKNTGHRHYITSMSSSSSILSYCAWRDIHDCHGAYLGSSSRNRVFPLVFCSICPPPPPPTTTTTITISNYSAALFYMVTKQSAAAVRTPFWRTDTPLHKT